MKHGFKALKGITLTELSVCTIIISFMLLGVFAANRTILSANNRGLTSDSLFLKTLYTAEHISRSASLATGTALDMGYTTFASPVETFCFRHDVNNPASFTDDIWVCYTRLNDAGTGLGVNLRYCEGVTPAACTLGGSVFIGTLVMDSFNPCFNFPLFCDGSFSLKIINRLDPLAGSDWETGPFMGIDLLTKGTEENPQVVHEINVHPEMHSF